MCSLYRLSVLLHYSIVFIKMYYKLAKVNHLAEHDGALLAYDVKLLVSRMPATANKRFCLFTLFWAKTTEQTFKGSPLFWLPKNVNQIQSESKIFTSDSARHKGAGLLKGIVQNHLQAVWGSCSHTIPTPNSPRRCCLTFVFLEIEEKREGNPITFHNTPKSI